jgi:hypothetical protein
MAFPGKRTRIKRKQKTKRAGSDAKRARDNKGTTVSVPLTGPLSASRRGVAVKAEKIVLH